MSGISRLASIFERYCHYEIPETIGNETVICRFFVDGSGTQYATGNGFVMNAGRGIITHDEESLRRFLESIPDMGGASENAKRGLAQWQDAYKILQNRARPRVAA